MCDGVLCTQAVFNMLDSDGDGEITATELQAAIGSIVGREVPEQEATDFLRWQLKPYFVNCSGLTCLLQCLAFLCKRVSSCIHFTVGLRTRMRTEHLILKSLFLHCFAHFETRRSSMCCCCRLPVCNPLCNKHGRSESSSSASRYAV